MKNNNKGAVNIILVILVVVVALGLGYFAFQKSDSSNDKQTENDQAAIKQLVESFGTKINSVDKISSEENVKADIQKYYSVFISPDLMSKWQANPKDAPGHIVSSPWPDRIEVDQISIISPTDYTVIGSLIWKTSTGESKQGVYLSVVKEDDEWLINNFTITGPEVASDPYAGHIILSAGSPPDWSHPKIGSSSEIFWDYSGVLREKIRSSKNTLVLSATLESTEKLGSYLGRGGFLVGDHFNFVFRENLKSSADGGKQLGSSEILNTTSLNWIVGKLSNQPCPPGGLCQGPNAEKNYEERARITAGKYTITVCVFDGMDKYCSNKVTVELVEPNETAP